jgi:acylphosphatase
MTQEERRQAYYEYVPDDGEWWIKEPPSREPWFESELALIGGHHPNGKPNLRVVWGGTEMGDISFRPQLKYQATREIVKGYNYERKDGSVGYVRKGHRMSEEEITEIADKTKFVPRREKHHFGRLRWHIEIYRSPEKLEELGRFKKLHSPDGTRWLRDLPREGVYDFFFLVQRKNSRYRDLDREVLMAVEAMYFHNLKAEEAQIGLDAIEEHNENRILMNAQARNAIVH